MGLDSDPERKARVIQRSWLIAMSGWCANWQEVETHLVALGYEDAPQWLHDAELRQAMDRVCRESREALIAHSSAEVKTGPFPTRRPS